MNILVTGASGFLGSRLLGSLAQSEHHVIAIARALPGQIPSKCQNIRWIVGDIAKDGLLTTALPTIDVVVHLAGTGWANGRRLDQGTDEHLFLRDNEETTVRLLQALSATTRRFVVASSQVVYGQPDSIDVTEDFPLPSPFSAYACSKINSENWSRWFQSAHGVQCITLRFCGFIDGGGIVDYLIDRALKKQPMELYSRGKTCRDYLSSESAVKALISAIQYSGPPEFLPINIGSGQQVTAADLAKVICQELNTNCEIQLLEKPSPQKNFVYRIDRARKLLGFDPGDLLTEVRKYAQARKARIVGVE